MITRQICEEAVRQVRAGLVEVGVSPDAVRPTDDAGRKSGYRIEFNMMDDWLNIWKATALSALRQMGADHPMSCPHCVNISGLHQCPRYPVGALLAGATKGCAS